MEFKHPKYYKNLRKLARLRNRDQAISLQASTEDAGRTPGTGLKLGEMDIASSKQQAYKHLSSQAREQALRRQAVRESTSVGYDPNH